jgi:hypothetical protein
LVKEVRLYSWDRDKSGNMIPKPAGGLDHLLDATRYVYLTKVSKNQGFVVSSGKVIS